MTIVNFARYFCYYETESNVFILIVLLIFILCSVHSNQCFGICAINVDAKMWIFSCAKQYLSQMLKTPKFFARLHWIGNFMVIIYVLNATFRSKYRRETKLH